MLFDCEFSIYSILLLPSLHRGGRRPSATFPRRRPRGARDTHHIARSQFTVLIASPHENPSWDTTTASSVPPFFRINRIMGDSPSPVNAPACVVATEICFTLSRSSIFTRFLLNFHQTRKILNKPVTFEVLDEGGLILGFLIAVT